MTVKVPLESITGFRLELLNDPNLPRNGPGPLDQGHRRAVGVRGRGGPRGRVAKVQKVKLVSATADAEAAEAPLEAIFDDKTNKKRTIGPVAFAIDGKEDTAWSVDIGPGRRNLPARRSSCPEKPLAFKGGATVIIYLSQRHGGWNSDDNQTYNLGRFRLSVTAAPSPWPTPSRRRYAPRWRSPRKQRTPGQDLLIFSHWRTTVADWKDANDKIEALWKQHPEGSLQLALLERDAMRPTHLLRRGDFLHPEKAVTPGVPGFLNSLRATDPRTGSRSPAGWSTASRPRRRARSSTASGRATSAPVWSPRARTSARSPRRPPSELLDWLAVEFMEKGWSFKSLQRLIVTSSTVPAVVEGHGRRPGARSRPTGLLARGPALPRRTARSCRDIALAASGLLKRRSAARASIRPRRACSSCRPVSYGPKVWKEETGENRFRRAIYTFRYRSVPYPAPAGLRHAARRSVLRPPLALEHAAAGADDAERAALRGVRPGAGARIMKEGGASV
jgi:hypothetical protein